MIASSALTDVRVRVARSEVGINTDDIDEEGKQRGTTSERVVLSVVGPSRRVVTWSKNN